MPFDPAGNASLPPSTWATAGQTIRTEQHNPPFRDIEQMLSGVLKRDGRDGMVGVLNMGGFPINNVGVGTSPNSAATVGQIQSSAPVGAVIAFAGQTAPSGWLLCYGQEVSRSTYADLFAALGTRYGAGNGSTTFNRPDCRDVAIVGRGNMGGTAKGLLSKFASTVLGSIFGVQEHVLTAPQMAKHTHPVTGTAGSAGAHSHTYTVRTGGGSAPTEAAWAVGGTTQGTPSTSTTGAHTHSVSGTANEVGGDEPHPNVQPTIVMNYIIRASYA